MAHVIKPNTCSTCHWRDTINGKFYCRWFPKSVSVLVVGMTAQGPQLGNVSALPEVSADDWCAQFKSRIEIAK